MGKRVKHTAGYCFLVVLTIAILTCVVIYVDHLYVKQKQTAYIRQIEEFKRYIATEKEWILANQNAEGAIYLFDEKNQGQGDVNPYFACISAMSLLGGDVSREELEAVEKYLKWHHKVFLEQKGKVENYKLKNGTLEPSGEYDSVDSYVALYLLLLGKYGLCGGNLKEIEANGETILLGTDILQSITEEGLTITDDDSGVIYTMDNIEVMAAYDSLYQFSESVYGKEFWGLEQEEMTKMFLDYRNRTQKAIVSRLYNDKQGRFEVGMLKNGNVMKFEGWNVMYPYAICQVYALNYSQQFKDVNLNDLYEKLSKTNHWENENRLKEDEFAWSELAFVGAKCGDDEKVLKYLNHYRAKTYLNRSYPVNTKEAAWIIMAYAQLIENCSKEMQKTLFEDIWEQWRENS